MFDPDLKRVSICLSTQFLQRYPNTKIEHELSAEVQYAKTGNDLHQNIEKMFQGLHKKKLLFLFILKAYNLYDIKTALDEIHFRQLAM